jgi:hypothetical protein
MCKRALLVAAFVFVVSAGAANAAPRLAPVRGVVVGSQRGVVLVASPTGLVRAVTGRAVTGSRVLISGGRIIVLGHATRAVIRGVVVRRSGGLTFLSAARHLIVVHSATRSVASARDATPPPGTVVQQTVSIDDQGELDDQGEQQLGQSGPIQVQAVVAAVGTGTVTLTVNGQTLIIPLPAGLTLPNSLVGTQVTLNLSFANGQTTAEDDQGENEGGDDATESNGSTSS